MLSKRPEARALALILGVIAASTAVLAQFGNFGGAFRVEPNIPYDGQFTFVRVKYQTAPGGYWYRGWPSWAHGYPIAEENLMKIMNDVSYLAPHTDSINTLALDDPELTHYPVIYIIEVGWWMLTDSEAAALRAYILKGGFVIVDDFKLTGDRGGGGWETFAANMERVLPGARFYEMDASHPIYHTFFEINDLSIVPQAYNVGRPIFRGLYENNDRTKRLQMIVNYNTDISQFWEWSGRGFRPVADTNEAYKLGVNYIMYGLTH
jgi:hypothetical protein